MSELKYGGERGEQWWLFYCWRCEQWCQDAGPWCALYLDEGLTSACRFEDQPWLKGGVPRSLEPLSLVPAAQPPQQDAEQSGDRDRSEDQDED